MEKRYDHSHEKKTMEMYGGIISHQGGHTFYLKILYLNNFITKDFKSVACRQFQLCNILFNINVI